MGCGNRRMQQNNLERFLSTDFNRAQEFGAAQLSNLMRYFAGMRLGQQELGGTLLTAPSYATPSTPIVDIFEGLTAIPQIGNQSVRVLAGVMGTRDPDVVETGDSSVYKLVSDPGITVDGSLVIAANSSGSTRIDVIECQRVEVVQEMDSRDIYNPTTGLFSPGLVDKVKKSSLVYRVRQGTPGSGYPGTVSGWLPLAIASVPNGSANNDTVCFWDVRPLVGDRVWGPNMAPSSTPLTPRQLDVAGTWEISGTEVRIYGFTYLDSMGLVAGGKLSKGVGVANEAWIDTWDAENAEPGFAPPANRLIYLWLLFPEFLPRWVRYTGPAAGVRWPMGTRGIPVLSLTGPSPSSGLRPLAPINLPTIAGLTNAAIIGCCPIAFMTDTTTRPGTFSCDGAWIFPAFSALPAAVVPYVGAGTLGQEAYRLVNGTSFPNGARSLKVRVQISIAGPANTTYSYQGRPILRDTTGTPIATGFGMCGGSITIPAGGTAIIYQDFEIAVSNPWAGVGIDADVRVEVNWNISGGTKSNETMRVLGWKYA